MLLSKLSRPVYHYTEPVCKAAIVKLHQMPRWIEVVKPDAGSRLSAQGRWYPSARSEDLALLSSIFLEFDLMYADLCDFVLNAWELKG